MKINFQYQGKYLILKV